MGQSSGLKLSHSPHVKSVMESLKNLSTEVINARSSLTAYVPNDENMMEERKALLTQMTNFIIDISDMDIRDESGDSSGLRNVLSMAVISVSDLVFAIQTSELSFLFDRYNFEELITSVTQAFDVYEGKEGKIQPAMSNSSLDELNKRISNLEARPKFEDLLNKALFKKYGTDINALLNSVKKLESDSKSAFENVELICEDAKKTIELKISELDDLQGVVAGKELAGSYDVSANSEKKVADWLRIGSVFCMGVIAVVVLYSLWETTTQDFNWQESLFRLIFSVVLSIPAAYLARESAKHRQQQYHYHQTSLDLKAITPYIASLPDEEQHKLKSEIAQRLFAPKNASPAAPAQDPYPLNTHEVLIALLNKLDFKQPRPAAQPAEGQKDQKVTP